MINLAFAPKVKIMPKCGNPHEVRVSSTSEKTPLLRAGFRKNHFCTNAAEDFTLLAQSL
jgi:hypothetical protein